MNNENSCLIQKQVTKENKKHRVGQTEDKK